MIEIGRQSCAECSGAGYLWPPPDPHAWLRCSACDGLGVVWAPGGPKFGATLELGDRNPGEIVELATGDRVRVLWHMPRNSPTTTFVALIDAFDGTESHNPIPVASEIGVVSISADVVASAARPTTDLHDGDKDADLVDPIAARNRKDLM